jgi:hypothetical protein
VVLLELVLVLVLLLLLLLLLALPFLLPLLLLLILLLVLVLSSDRRSRNIPEVVLVRRWAVGVLGIWRGRVWVMGGTRGVSLQAT